MRHQTIDTAAVLRDLKEAQANGTPDAVRERELATVLGYWPTDLVRLAAKAGAAWHALTEPPTWGVDVEEIVVFVRDFLDRKARWPTIDEQRRYFGRAPTDRLPGETAQQEALPL